MAISKRAIFLVTSLAWLSLPAQAQTGAATGSAGSAAGSTGAAGTTLSNGTTINGTGGSPGPNTSNALNHPTTGNNMGAPQTSGVSGSAASSHGNAVDTPVANSAVQSLGNTDTGILKK